MACFTGWPGRTWLILEDGAPLSDKEGEKADGETEADAISMDKPTGGERGEEERCLSSGHTRNSSLVRNGA